MASITDCVVEGLKYPFNDITKLLGFGAMFALLSVLSTFIGIKTFQVFRILENVIESTNTTVSGIPVSQLPAGDINIIIALSVLSFIVSLFIFGYQYDVLKFSIEKKSDLPGFGDILGMLIKGIKYFIVTLAYNIIPTLVLVGGIMMAGDSSYVMLFVLIAALLFIAAYFLLIMALNNMVDYDSLKKAFDFRQILDNISNLGWGKYVGIIIFTIIVYMIVMVAVGFILSILTGVFAAAIPKQLVLVSAIVVVIEGLFVDSYAALFYNRVCGSVYRKSIK